MLQQYHYLMKRLLRHLPLTARHVCTELTSKIFHARVNKYMSATQEVQLDKEGKVVKAEQS